MLKKTKWYEVALTHYKNVLVEIEDTGDEDENLQIASDVAYAEYCPDEIEVQCEVDSNNLNAAFYDEVLPL